METISKLDKIVIDVETTGLDTFKDKLLGISTYENGSTTYNPCPSLFSIDNETDYVIAHNGKFDAKVIFNKFKHYPDINFDTQIAYYLLHIDRPRKLETIVKDLFNIDKEDLMTVYNRITGEKRKTLPQDWYTKIPETDLAKYAQEDVKWTYKIYEYCEREFKKRSELYKWFKEIEMPLCNLLVQSELKGVRINRKKLHSLEENVAARIKELEQELKWLAERPNLNLNSSKQLQEVLYKDFKLPEFKKTKTGISTDTQTLKKLASIHSFPKALLDYRELTKMQTAFIKPLQEQADSNDRLHATFNQMGTRTRRMSCSHPNLQQIPAKSELGKQIRECFVPEPGYKFLIADYSQIELRLLAHFSEDPSMIAAFNEGRDLHQETADLLKIKRDPYAKIFNFSLIYGKTKYGLAKDMNCSEEEAQAMIDRFYSKRKRVKEWIREQQIDCQANSGWIKTLAGLPLFVENINSNDRWKFEEAKRQAVNYIIQGSSQDILKKAVIDISNGTDGGMIPVLLVHDELVYEIPDTSLKAPVYQGMKNAWKLKVPLEVSYKISDHWEK